MALALGTMVANDRTGQAHGIVLEEKRTGLLDSLILEQLDNVWNRSPYGTPRLTRRSFATETTSGFLNDVQRHVFRSRSLAHVLAYYSNEPTTARITRLATKRKIQGTTHLMPGNGPGL